MLPKTEEILVKFREINRKHFYECARDFKPADHFGLGQGSYYGDFKEVEEIYQLMYSLHLLLDQQIFYGYYDSAYSHPMEPISAIQELNIYLIGQIDNLTQVNEKYKGQMIPVRSTLDHYLKTQKALEYVISLPEIKNQIGDPEKEQLKEALIKTKVTSSFKAKQQKIVVLFGFYLLCFIVPTILIIVSWNRNYTGKWFQLGLFLFPLIGFLYDRNDFMEIFKFTFSKAYRYKLKNEIEAKVKSNYS